ncbi:MAG: FHA domain-containing protein, partial [Janthinobacterium lividum]
MPTLDLPANGEPLLMGRSSNSSDFQLSANRHISRVHVRASYHAPDAEHPAGKVEVECLGWNGVKVHCRGEVSELPKGEIFTSDKPLAQIMIDVQDTRVMLVWPKESSREPPSVESRSPWAVESPTKRRAIPAPVFASSPPAMLPPRLQSPVSPSPLYATFSSTFRADQEEVKVYEDQDSEEDAPHDATPELFPLNTPEDPFVETESQVVKASHSSALSDPEELSEHDEENDPIVHSFGPFGENILSRFQSFQPTSPERKRKPLKAATNSPGRAASWPKASSSPIKNHVINQLAF